MNGRSLLFPFTRRTLNAATVGSDVECETRRHRWGGGEVGAARRACLERRRIWKRWRDGTEKDSSRGSTGVVVPTLDGIFKHRTWRLHSWRPTANIVAVSTCFHAEKSRVQLCAVGPKTAGRFEQTIDAQRSINDSLSYASTTERRPKATPTMTCLARLTKRRPITRRLVRRAGQIIIYVVFDLHSVFETYDRRSLTERFHKYY